MDAMRVQEMLRKFGFETDVDDPVVEDSTKEEVQPEPPQVNTRCSKCSILRTSSSELFSHSIHCRGNHRALSYCWSCGRNFIFRSLLLKHKKMCNKMRQRKSNNKKLLREMLTVAKNWVEEQMSPSSDTKDARKLSPSNSDVPTTSTFCSTCKQKFSSAKMFEIHLKNCLCRSSESYKCRTCNREFPQRSDLGLHEKYCGQPKQVMQANSISSTHSDDESDQADEIMCRCCEKEFEAPYWLEKHLKKNTSCAKVHNLKIHLSAAAQKLYEPSRTARKSLSNMKNQSVDSPPIARKSIDSPPIKRKYMDSPPTKRKSIDSPPETKRFKKLYLDESKYGISKDRESGNSSDSYLPPIGAARKSFTSRKRKSTPNPFCSVCYRYFPSLTLLRQHEETHNQKKKPESVENKCPQCYKIFKDKSSLFDHQKELDHWGKATKSLSSLCRCPFCNKEFYLLKSRNAHLRVHIADRPEAVKMFLKKTTCEICSQVFVSESAKIQHSRIKHPHQVSTPTAQSEERDLMSEESVNEQIEANEAVIDDADEDDEITYLGKHTVNPDAIYSRKQPVSYLDKSDESYSEISGIHITNALKAKLKKYPTVCPICNKKYSSVFIRNRHFRVHTLDRAFECNYCFQKFNRADRLTQHMQQVHKDILGYECKLCKLRFNIWMRALQHCSKAHPAYQAKSLIRQRDVFSSSAQEKYSKYASADFMTKTNNKRSAMSNEEFYCDVCELSFLKLCGLQRHRQSKLHLAILEKSRSLARQRVPMKGPVPQRIPARTVTPPVIDYERKINCSTCNSEFDNVNDFVPHRLSHFSSQINANQIDELNPYLCEICGKEMDNHQTIQLHLFWHLQDVQMQGGSAKSSHAKNLVSAMNTASLQPVAKKTMGNSASANPELFIGGVKKPLFTCSACNIGFTTKLHYTVHVQQYCRVLKSKPSVQPQNKVEKPPTVVSKVKHSCQVCSAEFDSIDDLTTHEKDCVSSSNKYYCQVCCCIFSFPDLVERHKEFCQDNPFNEEHEDLEKLNIETLAPVMNETTAIVGCIQCNVAFDAMQKLSDHISTHGSQLQKTTNEHVTENGIPASDNIINEKELMLDIESKNSEQESMHGEPSSLKEAAFQALSVENNITFSNQYTDATASTSKETTGFQIESENVMDIEPNQTLESDITAFPGLSSSTTLKDSENAQVIEKLRKDFARLLCVLVSDPELMQRLGYGEKPIDEVLVNVLGQMALTPIPETTKCSELERLRQNIRILLDVCIKDQIMELIADGEASTDTIVEAALKMFGVGDEEESASELPTV